jgi:hypothetical protein
MAQRYPGSDRVYAGVRDRLFVDLAICGYRQPAGRRHLLEKLMGRQGQDPHLVQYYDEREFWSIFNRENHFAAKRVTDPRNRFRDLYTKTCRASRGLD